MIRSMAELHAEAVSVQDACNLCGIVQSFAKAMLDIRMQCKGTKQANSNQITRLWADKILSLTGEVEFGDYTFDQGETI